MDTAPGQVELHRDGDILYGRGTVDAKGPLMAFIVAAARAGALPNVRVTVVGAVEEEARSSRGANFLLEHHAAPDAVVIGEPSNWDRITLGYKGSLHLDYSVEQDEAHTAAESRTACELAVEYWWRVKRWAHDHNQDRQRLFDRLDPSLLHLCHRSDGLRAAVDMDIRLRLPLGFDVDAFVEEATSWAGGATVEAGGLEQPFRAEKRNLLVAAFVSAIRDEGGKTAFVSKTGTSDMNVVGPRWKCPILAYGPGDSALDHTPNEHVCVTEYLRAIRVLTRALRQFAAG
jgi:LysW-gamma-L-lysine carboxypeptidase